MPEWNKTTACVLRRLRRVSLPTEQWRPTAHEEACVDQVWLFVGVQRGGWDAKQNWNFVERKLRTGVRERLRQLFADDAFRPDGGAARDAFKRADLLRWGDRLLADAAAAAANAAGAPPRGSFFSDPADDAAAAAEAPPEAALASALAGLPDDVRAIVEGIAARAATEGCEVTDLKMLVRYARNRFVNASCEFGAADAALAGLVDAPAAPGGADRISAPSRTRSDRDDVSIDLSTIGTWPSETRSDRDAASVASDMRFLSLSNLSLVSRRDALRLLHRDMVDEKVRVDAMPGLTPTFPKTERGAKKAVRKVKHAAKKSARALRDIFAT